MNVSFTSLLLPVLGLATILGTASAQNVRLEDLGLELADQSTPAYAVGNVNDKPADPENWVEVEATFAIEVAQGDGWTDSLTIRWYVGMVDQDGQGIVLPAEVRYLDVPAGEELHASVYVAPRTIQRITGRDRVQASDVQYMAAVVLDANNSPLGGVDQDGIFGPDEISSKWFSSNEAAKREGVLRPRRETPFSVLWTDYYLEEAGDV